MRINSYTVVVRIVVNAESEEQAISAVDNVLQKEDKAFVDYKIDYADKE